MGRSSSCYDWSFRPISNSHVHYVLHHHQQSIFQKSKNAYFVGKMRCYQVLSGACNTSNKCSAVGSVEGIPFSAYGSGSNVVILAVSFERVQIIPSSADTQVDCLDCSNDTGIIAAAYGSKVVIFEPSPLPQQNSPHKLDYWWVEKTSFDVSFPVHSLEFNQDGTRLLIGGAQIQLWRYNTGHHHVATVVDSKKKKKVSFDMGNDSEESDSEDDSTTEVYRDWVCIWTSQELDESVLHLSFSADGSFFASCGSEDNLVRVWYEDPCLNFFLDDEDHSPRTHAQFCPLSFKYLLLVHPLTVTSLAWRATSKYMPRDSVGNVLVTSCKDNVCRVWAETLLPDDGIASVSTLSTGTGSLLRSKCQRQKRKLIQRLKHFRTCFQLRQDEGYHEDGPEFKSFKTLPVLLSSYSISDGQMLGNDTYTSRSKHFHLACSINAETDIPLTPSFSASELNSNLFVLHWLNNKEMYFTMKTEQLLEEFSSHIDFDAENESSPNHVSSTPVLTPQMELASSKKSVRATTGDLSKFMRSQMKADEFSHDGGMETPTQPGLSRVSSTLSQASVPLNAPPTTKLDAFDRKIETLLQDWQTGSDLLFAVHPADGSLLVWTVDYLDEQLSGVFRQPQVSFSSRLPSAIPKGDAATLSPSIALYNACHKFDASQIFENLKRPAKFSVREEDEEDSDSDSEAERPKMTKFSRRISIIEDENTTKVVSDDYLTSEDPFTPGPSPIISMVTKHTNGTMNLWHLTFSDESRFSHLLSIRHATRISGHRYTVKTVACHPVLPLMLTSSHHARSPGSDARSFQSELILWRVDTIGPLCRSGGVSELARIDSIDPSAFSCVEWIPTLLPGLSTGPASSSSACFLASDGKNLTIYQAVIDSRPLVLSQGDMKKAVLNEKLEQRELTTFRSGLIVPLQTIKGAISETQEISFMHVFQEQFISGDRPVLESAGDLHGCSFSSRSFRGLPRPPSLIEKSYSAVVDLHNLSSFQEPFYLTVVQKSHTGSSVSMWKIVLDYHSVLDDLKDAQSPDKSGLSVNTYRFSELNLPLPQGVEVTMVKPAAGHLSSACIYPACFAPYILVTACSDNTLRFWKYEETRRAWAEWEMLSKSKSSKLVIPGEVFDVNAAYSGRIAVAYQDGPIRLKIVNGEDVCTAEVNIAVYECESSGGSNWVIEDTIHLSEVPVSAGSARAIAIGKSPVRNHPHRKSNDIFPSPSLNTVHKFERSKKVVSENHNRKCIMLDWASREDGSHILTVSVGSKILLYAPVSNHIVLVKTQSKPTLLRQQTQTDLPKRGLTWMRLRSVNLKTGDGLPPIPMCIAWVREGMLVACMSNELSIYCQWKQQDSLTTVTSSLSDNEDGRNLQDRDLIDIAHETTPGRLPYAPSMNHLPRASSTFALSSGSTRKRNKVTSNKSSPSQSLVSDRSAFADYLPDYGLFGASQLASPILPQYHPVQLIELLNSGRIQWVKAILAHLVRCLVGNSGGSGFDSEEEATIQKAFYRNRSLSVSYTEKTDLSAVRPKTHESEDEVKTIPPLPLWTLLLADEDGTVSENAKAYDDLLSSEVDTGRLDLDGLDDSDPELGTSPKNRRARKPSGVDPMKLSDFTPLHAQRLSQLLTKLQLPGLNSSDQMQLLALADTVASCNPDAAGYLASEQSDGEVIRGTEALDECGLRFLLAMRQYTYLSRCLPPVQRGALRKTGIATYHIAWAFHSDAEEDLINLIPSVSKGNPTWEELRELGVAWWIRNNTTLRKIVEKVAKAAYQSKQNPLDAALYYLAMGKKSVVATLYKAARDTKMAEFWANDFKQDRWKTAALKNAFALLGMQRFFHAAAFFLLAGSLKDAIEVCLDRLEDLQLAIIICRLYEGERESVPGSFLGLLKKRVIGSDGEQKCKDPFLRSMGNWLMQDYAASLNTLLEAPNEDDIKLSTDLGSETAPAVFNYYIFLRSHPLLVRYQTSGGNVEKSKALSAVQKVNFGVSISSLERRLYFTTAHAHFKAGCPVLALEVLSKLPDRLSANGSLDPIASRGSLESCLEGSQSDGSLVVNGTCDGSDAFDWSTPVSSKLANKDSLDTASGLDWSKPSTKLDLDWSQPLSRFEEPKLDWRIESDSEEESAPASPAPPPPTDVKEEKQGPLDIMGQQMKFIVCLKILMEEMSTLATGYEVDGGQLRLQLYVWLEKEVDALKKLCSYGSESVNQSDGSENDGEAHDRSLTPISERPTLQQIMKAEKLDLEARVQWMAKRRQWLKENETLLRTLLSYCSLHGAQGGGLASVRMELILLLQELQQERIGLMVKGGSSELSTPLPAPVTVPLIASVAAGTKMFTTDPIRHLQLMVSDMLQSLVGLRTPPHPGRHAPLRQMCLLRDLAIALSACVYQGLCGLEGLDTSSQGNSSFDAVKGLTTAYRDFHLIGIASKKRSTSGGDDNLSPTSQPSKWPGVEYLRAVLYKEADQNPQSLLTLLCECFVGIYVSLFSYALVACDSHMLFRLAALNPSDETFGRVFGGGAKKVVRVSASGGGSSQASSGPEPNQGSPLSSQRVRLHMRILGENSAGSSQGSPKSRPPRPLPPRPYLPGQSEDIPTYKEVFVPPETSLMAYMMAKPKLPLEVAQIDYDSSESDDEVDDIEPFEDESEDELDDKKKKPRKYVNKEFSDTDSISWSIVRVALVKLASLQMEKFLRVAGTEVQDLPSVSPPLHAMYRTLAKWHEWFYDRYASLGPPPPSYMASCSVENTFEFQGPPISKYRSLLDAASTPFESTMETKAVRRLWSYLVRQESVQEMFIRLVFGTRRRMGGLSFCESASVISESDIDEIETMTKVNKNILAVRILQKEQESIAAFCINKANPGIVSLACGNEIQELDISQMLDATKPYDDECNLDLLAFDRDLDILPTPNYLLVQTPNDKPFLDSMEPGLNHSGSTNSIYSPSHGYGNQATKGVTVTRRQKAENVRRLCPHPTLPIYLSGCSDGSVQVWEWGHTGVLCTPRPAGTYAKVHRLRFSSLGNKFGAADGDGNVSLWQLKLTAPPVKPFFTYQCHNKSAADFHFVGSSSVLVTAGLSTDGKNVALWDTLMPQKKSQIHGFVCHDAGATCILYAPQHQTLISAGKKGEVCVWDIRQRSLRQRFTAHENSAAVRAMAMDPGEEYYATGSSEGDIKVWNVENQEMLLALPGEHSRPGFFRPMSSSNHGVNLLNIDAEGRLYSCGSDGSFKFRCLPYKDWTVTGH